MGTKLPFFALFYLVFEGKFQVQASQGAYIRRGDLTEGFLRYDLGGLYLEGLIHGGAYFWNFRVVSFAAVSRVATQRSSCVTNLKTAAKEASG